MSRVVFKNKPKLSEDEVDKNFNERRLALIPHVEEYLNGHEKFANKEIAVTFSHKGISSLVSIIETSDGKFVLKVALSKSYSSGEGIFLKVWEKIGVKVPHVYDEGELNGQPYTLMEYIDAPLVSDVYDHEKMIEKKIYLDMGRILKRMHEPLGKGYGLVVVDSGEYKTFSEWLAGPDMQKRVKYVMENNLLKDEYGSIDIIFEILSAHVERENRISYCHDDFGGNIFATEPLTVFDPNPRFNNGYIDLGRTLAHYIAKGAFPNQLIEGYFGEEPYDRKALHCSILLNIMMKLPYSHKKGRSEIIQSWQDYLADNSSILEDLPAL